MADLPLSTPRAPNASLANVPKYSCVLGRRRTRRGPRGSEGPSPGGPTTGRGQPRHRRAPDARPRHRPRSPDPPRPHRRSRRRRRWRARAAQRWCPASRLVRPGGPPGGRRRRPPPPRRPTRYTQRGHRADHAETRRVERVVITQCLRTDFLPADCAGATCQCVSYAGVSVREARLWGGAVGRRVAIPAIGGLGVIVTVGAKVFNGGCGHVDRDGATGPPAAHGGEEQQRGA